MWLIENNNLLYLTSFIFITNTLAAFYKKYYLYGLLFAGLTITSLCVHSNKYIYNNKSHKINIIDKIIIASIFFYGGYILYTKFNKNPTLNIIIITTFLACLWLYFYGCFDKNPAISTKCRALLHMIGSFGHHLIIFL